ncbi:hypothetical protein AWB94_04915 [Mycolicibacterium canariasense]|nr:hypothetical protein AWB94_04915 [Mycolicibacterium canariasense]
MSDMTTTVNQLLGMHPEVRLRYCTQPRRWECEKAAPEVWFGEPMLTSALNGPVWNRHGDIIKLAVSNGTWLWKLTGKTTDSANIYGPFRIFQAVWPD